MQYSEAWWTRPLNPRTQEAGGISVRWEVCDPGGRLSSVGKVSLSSTCGIHTLLVYLERLSNFCFVCPPPARIHTHLVILE